MPIYTFYPYTAEGAALMFEVVDLVDDSAAATHAARLLTLHASASEVVVWEVDREVHREARVPAPSQGRSTSLEPRA